MKWFTRILAVLVAVVFGTGPVAIAQDRTPWLNVNIDIKARTESLLIGPAGGLGTRWNQVLGKSASGLLDSNGVPSSVGFTTNAGSLDPWENGQLTLLLAAAFMFGSPASANLVISGLTPGHSYDLYIASGYPNENGSQGRWNTTNTTSNGKIQMLDNGVRGGSGGNLMTWAQGVNYVLFQNIVPDPATDKINVTFDSFAGSRCMLSGFQLVDVTFAPTTTALALTGGTNPSIFGASVTFAATVTGINAPSGDVIFYDGGTTIGTSVLNGSFQASFTTSTLAIGVHSIKARYAGNETNPTSTSAPLSHTVLDARPATITTLALTSGANPSAPGASLTFTATVAGVTPSGNVTFYDYDGRSVTPIGTLQIQPIGTSALNGSFQASVTTTTLACGVHSITARYAGDVNNAPSTSAPHYSQKVNPLTGNGKLKVFILAGQSNMEGVGKVDLGGNPITSNREPNVIAGLGSLRAMVNNNPDQYGYLVDPSHPIAYPSYTGGTTYPGWVTRTDVWVSYWDENGSGVTVERRNGALGVGFGAQYGLPEGYIGPEYGFGQVVGNSLDDQVLLIKTAWGGKSLAVEFRPPSSSGNTGPYYTTMISKAHQVLNNLATYYPGYNGSGYEIVGFGWHQGWNDRVSAAYTAEYEVNLANLIRDIRTEFGVPNMPFVIGNTGMADANGDSTAVALIAAQGAVSDPGKHPEFAGTVATVDTRPFDFGQNSPAPVFGYHWNFNGESYFRIGEGMGAAMVALQSPSPNPPADLVATGGDQQVSLVWSAPAEGPEPTGYQVLRAGVQIAEVGAAPASYTDSDATLVPGTEYCYTVKSVAGARTSAASNGSCGTTAPAATAKFKRADMNDDGLLNISDPIYLLNYLFIGGPAPKCPDAGHINSDPDVDISDVVYLLLYLFTGSPAPPYAGYPDCEEFPTCAGKGNFCP